ncbi:DUF4185 domain-containing protein [Mucilaginibacter limnophilus]|uniref:DUF4185 domain-containing protein n=1 Tax=Mucilaginibacter limnophilus TaxID=1932778 RepID=A0A3S2VK60_9SPHI|nr:RICIN domain-containing protein [Mucilaginibacter limnophilus]RVT97269.1 DUF4185 domain-containing protein [Mucilaginibacter limnophilus]
MRLRLLMSLLPAAAVMLTQQSCTKKNAPAAATAVKTDTTKTLRNAEDPGEFLIIKAINLGSKKALEIGGYNLQDNAMAKQNTFLNNAPASNNNYQKWKVRNVGSGYYTVMNLGSGKYLEGMNANQQVIQKRAAITDKQLWSIEAVTGGYKIINKANGLVLSVAQSDLNGSPVGLAAYQNSPYQQWSMQILPVDSYRDDAVVGFFQRTSGSTAFDGGSSVPLSTGQVLWLTNDAFYNQINSTGNFNCNTIFPYRNTALVQPASKSWDPAQTVNITSPYGNEIFRTTDNKNLLWPGAGIQVGSKVYVHNIEVPRNNLNTVNQYLSEMRSNGTTSIPQVINHSIPGMTGQTDIIYSIGMVKPGDGYVYVYGAGGFIGAGVYVARFAESAPLTWTFWNGSTWATTPTTASAARVYSGSVNNNTVGFVKGKFVIVDMSFGFTCDVEPRDMYTSISTSPTGPFTNKRKVYTLPDIKQGHKPVFYNPTIHAEFDNGDNELLVNYCVNFYSKNDGTGATCLTDCSNADGSKDPNDYRPKGVRIPYSLIGL